ncbi:hypothetical protein D9M71_82560 [compost metagenome]
MSAFSRTIRALGMPLVGFGLIGTLQAADIPGLPAPLDAKVVAEQQSTASEQERIYPLGPVRKISGQLRMEGQIKSRGHISSITYELAPEQTAGEAFTAARKVLQQQGGYLLFRCQARDCGESSVWINEILSTSARISGGDEQQSFLLLRKAEPEHDTLIAVYAITRGNRKAYLHVEQFVADELPKELLPTASTVVWELRSTGELDYPDLDGEPSAAWVTLLSRGLNLDSSLRVSLSGKQAQAWRQALVGAGVRPARLEAGTEEVPGLHLELIR